jgi:hypothetical protein
MPRKKPIKKFVLSEKRKKFLKRNFEKVRPDSLSKAELSYYNKIKAGKTRAKKAIRIDGRYLSGAIIDVIAQVAHRKGVSIQKYIDENKEAIIKLIEEGYTHTFKTIDNAIDIVNNLKRKTVEVDTGNGMVRMGKNETIALLSEFQQHVKSTTNIVMLATNVKVFKNNKIRLTIPENFPEYIGENLKDYLDEFEDIHYIES